MQNPPLIVGTGAIGLFLSHLLEPIGPVEVLSRGETLADLRAGGFEVRVGDATTRHRPPAWSWLDWISSKARRAVVLAVKAVDLDPALDDLARRPEGIECLFLLQNGLGIMERADERLPGLPKVRMSCYTGVTREGRTAIRIHGRGPFGLAAGPGGERSLQSFSACLEAAGFPVRPADSPARLEWEKAAMNLVVNGVCTAVGARNGAVLDSPPLRELAGVMLAECQAVAAARGIPTDGVCEASVFSAIERVRDNLNSTLQDLQAGRPTELPFLHGTILRWADQAGLAVPVTRALYMRLRQMEWASRQGGGGGGLDTGLR